MTRALTLLFLNAGRRVELIRGFRRAFELLGLDGRIVTTDVPILGRVTCHRVMVPQLAGAMAELVERGLADLIDVSQFGGCWVPRFIASDPTRGISLHSWGIAVDLNVSTNHRGTVGDMDPRIVEVMAAWGFAWGGLWSDPDPMHFELAALRN